MTEKATATATRQAPDLLPRLSAGRHRSPAKGACFMEYASFLAGERWSDHPACTDPVLAELARCVNDLVHDSTRDSLVRDVPRVIGLRGDDRMSLQVGLRAAARALPFASLERQRSLAVAAKAIIAALADRAVTDSPVIDEARAALRETPHAADWAEEFLRRTGLRRMELIRTGCQAAVRTAVLGLAEACIPDSDERLVALLRTAIADCEDAVARRESPARDLVTV